MNKLIWVSGFAIALTTVGCASSDTDPYAQAADEVDQIASALEDGDDTTLETLADDTGLAPDGDAGVDESGDGGQRRGFGHRGRHHGHGRPGARHLLMWYGDLAALQACRDQREACDPSVDATCPQAVHDCMRSVLEDAFAAMCEDRTQQCSAADAPEGPCERIAERCAEGLPNGDRPDGSVGFPIFHHHHDGDDMMDDERPMDGDMMGALPPPPSN